MAEASFNSSGRWNAAAAAAAAHVAVFAQSSPIG